MNEAGKLYYENRGIQKSTELMQAEHLLCDKIKSCDRYKSLEVERTHYPIEFSFPAGTWQDLLDCLLPDSLPILCYIIKMPVALFYTVQKKSIFFCLAIFLFSSYLGFQYYRITISNNYREGWLVLSCFSWSYMQYLISYFGVKWQITLLSTNLYKS